MKKNNQVSEEYAQKVKLSVQDGSFFRDSMQWFVFQYVRPTVDRNLMVVFSLISAVCVFYLYEIIADSFPLIEEVPIIIREHDTSSVRPIIKKLESSKEKVIYGADESVLKYLLLNYVKERESFDFRRSDVKEVNRKFNIIKNNSSYLEYRGFRSQMSRSNPTSPIKFFGQDVFKEIEISSFKFIKREVKNKLSLLKQYFSPTISSSSEIRFKATIFSKNKEGKNVQNVKKYLAKISFDFPGLSRDEKSGVLNFSVNDYDLYEVK